MTKGYSLFELIVAVTIVIMVSGGGLIYLNNFLVNQKLDKVYSDVLSAIELSRNYAKVKQFPNGGLGDVRYVELSQTVAGKIVASVSDVGTSYFSKLVTENGVTLTFNPAVLYFWGGSGQLSTDINGTFFGPSQKAMVTVAINQGVAVTRTITINYLGNVE